MIRLQSVCKHFGAVAAVQDLGFELSPGEILGFLGPNGAGKSTTMRMIAGFIPPSSGSISVFGLDVASRATEVKRLIGYLPEGAPSYDDMTTMEFLRFAGEVRGYRGAELKRRTHAVIDQLELGEVVYRRIERLSKGFKRRVGIAQALLHDPQVLIMDEPTDGLDPNQKHHVRELIRGLSGDKIVIISTHILEEVDAVCSRAMIIGAGRLLADGSPADLERHCRSAGAVALRAEAPVDFASGLSGLAGVAAVEVDADGLGAVVYPLAGAHIFPGVFEVAHQRRWPLSSMSTLHGALDEVFRKLTSEDRP